MRVSCDRTHDAVWRVALQPGDEGTTALDRPGVEALYRELVRAEANAACRVVVLEGSGGEFCRGMDLAYVADHPDEDHTPAIKIFTACLRTMSSARYLVVSAVDGPALGGGLGLVAAADVAIATARSSFGLPELVFGLLPAVVLPALLERMPPQKARRLALVDTLDAEHARADGLVDELVEDSASLEKRVRATIRRALRLHPGAVTDLKRLTRGHALSAFAEGAARTAAMVADPQRQGPLAAWFQGEAPPWFDRYHPGRAP